MPTPAPSSHAGPGLGFERFIFFSDAVFAIAITLLVLDLKPPPGAHGAFDIAPFRPNLIGFTLSFYVIGRYWLAHHQLFETIRAYDRSVLVANLCLLASIAFLPFPTMVVAQYKAESGPVMFYAGSLALVGLLMILLVLIARRPSLMRPGETRGGTIHLVARMAGSPVVFAVTAGVAVRYPHQALWLLLLLVPVGQALERLGRLLERKIDAVKPARGPDRR